MQKLSSSILQATHPFKWLNILTKINNVVVEIITPVEMIKKGDKVGSSEVALLAKLGPEVLNLIEDSLIDKFAAGVSMIALLSLALSYPTLVATPLMFIDAYKNVLDVSVKTEYTFVL
ncbi:60S acidic ribosomal protein P0-1-like [Asparagus officinalis]|uniref:60S acidic ribosomal protein P0-1-like n=1 Tax=Asparagus officinalis TaxID=4686 RepID=UPI00098E61BC|nr:60S acidic ribosomal protein P0-1-like [Asparagus officinalis]